MLRNCIVLLLCSLTLQQTCAEENITEWRTLVHDQGYCALYGICGHRPDGDVLSCPLNARGRQLSQAAYNKLQTLCPQLTAASGGADGHYCCTEQQIDVMATSVRRPHPPHQTTTTTSTHSLTSRVCSLPAAQPAITISNTFSASSPAPPTKQPLPTSPQCSSPTTPTTPPSRLCPTT